MGSDVGDECLLGWATLGFGDVILNNEGIELIVSHFVKVGVHFVRFVRLVWIGFNLKVLVLYFMPSPHSSIFKSIFQGAFFFLISPSRKMVSRQG
jgi:hypothetical protein